MKPKVEFLLTPNDACTDLPPFSAWVSSHKCYFSSKSHRFFLAVFGFFLLCVIDPFTLSPFALFLPEDFPSFCTRPSFSIIVLFSVPHFFRFWFRTYFEFGNCKPPYPFPPPLLFIFFEGSPPPPGLPLRVGVCLPPTNRMKQFFTAEDKPSVPPPVCFEGCLHLPLLVPLHVPCLVSYFILERPTELLSFLSLRTHLPPHRVATPPPPPLHCF